MHAAVYKNALQLNKNDFVKQIHFLVNLVKLQRPIYPILLY